MAIKAKELRNKAKQNQKRMTEILEGSSEKMTPDQEKEFDALDTEAESLLRQADKIERMEKLEIQDDPGDPITTPKTKGINDLKPEERAKAEDLAMRSYLQTGSVPQELRALMPGAQAEKDDGEMITKALKELGIETRAQSTTTSGGGYTIPRGFQAELERAILAYGGMWEASRVVKTTKGNTLDWPLVDDTMNESYQLSESTSAAAGATDVVFAQQQFEAYKQTSGLIQVPTELLEDSEFNIPELMVDLLSERIFRGTNRAFTTADGSSKPHGIIATGNAVYGVSSGNDTVLAYDDVVNLEHSVDPSYRNRPGTAWMFHDTVLRELKKIKDQQNQPIWSPGLMQTGEPSRLMGYRYYINQHMPIFWAGNATDNDNDKAMIFGDLKKYIIRQVRNMRIVRLNERYGELDQVAFVVFFRIDGDLLNAGTNPVKYLRVSGT